MRDCLSPLGVFGTAFHEVGIKYIVGTKYSVRFVNHVTYRDLQTLRKRSLHSLNLVGLCADDMRPASGLKTKVGIPSVSPYPPLDHNMMVLDPLHSEYKVLPQLLSVPLHVNHREYTKHICLHISTHHQRGHVCSKASSRCRVQGKLVHM